MLQPLLLLLVVRLEAEVAGISQPLPLLPLLLIVVVLAALALLPLNQLPPLRLLREAPWLCVRQHCHPCCCDSDAWYG